MVFTLCQIVTPGRWLLPMTVLGLLLPFCYSHAAEIFEVGGRHEALIAYASRDALIAEFGRAFPLVDLSPADPKLDSRARNLVRRVDSQYRQLFPELMRNKAFPDFLVVDSDDLSNDVAYNRSTSVPGQYNGFLLIPRGLLKNANSESLATELLAHEMAHLFLKHTNIRNTYLKIWRQVGHDVQELKSVPEGFYTFIRYERVAGPLFQPEVAGLPFGESILLTAVYRLTQDLKKRFPGEECAQEAWTFMNSEFLEVYNKNFSALSGRFKADAAVEVQARLESYEQKVVACSTKLGFLGNFLRTANFLPVSPDSGGFIRNSMDKQFKWTDQNEFEVSFKLGKFLHSEMAKIWLQSRLETFRFRSFEDEADEFAITINRSLGLDPLALSAWFASYVESTQPGFTVQCRQAISKGDNLPFGDLADPHHSTCYRIHQIAKLVNDKGFQARP